MKRPALKNFRRIVVKVGSSLLVDSEAGRVKEEAKLAAKERTWRVQGWFDWEGYRERYGNIGRLDRLLEAEGDSTNRYKLAKQADVLMLLFLLSRGELRELLHGVKLALVVRVSEVEALRQSAGAR